jgi:RNAse (barnase) inhibitor barstar
VNNKQQFLAEVGQAFAFPDYYGRNWDAFEEMINDLSWIPATGYLLLYDHAHRFASSQPEAWQTAISILQSAAIRWQREGVPFYTLLRHNRHWNRNLPKFAA